MKKIKTILKRDWEGNGAITQEYAEGVSPEILSHAKATEKLDGQNVRLTVRNHTLVRLEKRRNPSKIEKAKGEVTIIIDKVVVKNPGAGGIVGTPKAVAAKPKKAAKAKPAKEGKAPKVKAEKKSK